MSQKIFILVASIFFTIVTILHSLRIVFDVQVNFGDRAIPMWFSVIAVIFAGFLAYTGLQLLKK